MGATKFEIYSEDIIQLTELFKAMGHPARLKALLLTANETDYDISATEIQNKIDLSQSTISQHLKQLRDVGLVKTKIIERKNKSCLVYRINDDALKYVEKIITYLEKKANIKSHNQFDSTSMFFTKFRKVSYSNQYFVT